MGVVALLLVGAMAASAVPAYRPLVCAPHREMALLESQAAASLSGIVTAISHTLVDVWCFLDKPNDLTPVLSRLWGLPSQWERCANRWGADRSQNLTLHLARPLGAFDPDAFRADITGLLRLSDSQAAVVHTQEGDRTLPGLNLTVPDLLRVDFRLETVRFEHVPAYEAFLTTAIQDNATFRARWGPVGGLEFVVVRPHRSFWEHLVAEGIIPAKDPLMTSARAIFLPDKECQRETLEAEIRVAGQPAAVVSDPHTPVVLSVNAPVSLPPGFIFARWYVIEGNATIADPLAASTAVTGLGIGRTVFAWVSIASGCPMPPSASGCCRAGLATVSIVRVDPPPAPVIVEARGGSWHILHGRDPPTPHASGMWCVGNGTAAVGASGHPEALVTGLSPGLNILKWILRYSGSVETVEEVWVNGHTVNTAPAVPLAVVLPLNTRISELTRINDRRKLEIKAYAIALRESQDLTLLATEYARSQSDGLSPCPINENNRCPAPEACIVAPATDCPLCSEPQAYPRGPIVQAVPAGSPPSSAPVDLSSRNRGTYIFLAILVVSGALFQYKYFRSKAQRTHDVTAKVVKELEERRATQDLQEQFARNLLCMMQSGDEPSVKDALRGYLEGQVTGGQLAQALAQVAERRSPAQANGLVGPPPPGDGDAPDPLAQPNPPPENATEDEDTEGINE